MTYKQTTAQELFEFHRDQVSKQLDMIHLVLEDLTNQQARDPNNWVFNGDMLHIKGLLAEVLSFARPVKVLRDD